MAGYDMVAFYKEDKAEISEHAEAIGRMYHLRVRYEKIPRLPSAVSVLTGEDTVLCLLARTAFGFRRLMKYAYALKRPVIIVHPSDSTDVYRHLKVPVGYLQENKEKVVWANFFQHHHPESGIELVVPQERDEHIAAMVQDNVAFIEQVLQKSKASYTKSFVKGGFEKTLQALFQESGDCLLFIMRPFRIFSFHLPFSIRLLRKYEHAPTMLIPRDDALYVPCH